MANVTTQLYPEDLYGNNPANDIVGEIIIVNAPTNPNDYFFTIPSAAPFYKNSLKVWDYNTNTLLVENVDYVIGHVFIEPLEKIGQYIAGSIRFLRFNLTAVVVNYHTLGAPWGFSDVAIARELANITVNPLIRTWGNIDPLPYSFPSLPHSNSMDDVVGSAQLKQALDEIITTLKNFGNGIPNNHINDYNNPHRTNSADVGLGNLDNFKTATLAEHLEGTAVDLFTTVAGVKAMIVDYGGSFTYATRIEAEESARNDVVMTPLRTYQQSVVNVLDPITTAFRDAADYIELNY